MNFLTPKIHIKSITQNGEISGYASVFNIIDSHNDVILPHAFQKSIDNGEKPKLLWQHDSSTPIGTIIDLYEDTYGLFIKAQLIMELPKAQEIYALLKNQAIDGFSIGYTINDKYIKNNIQYLTDIDLKEISIVTFPSCKKAIVNNIKSIYENDKKCLLAIKELSQQISNIIGQ